MIDRPAMDAAQLFEFCIFVALLPVIARGYIEFLRELLNRDGRIHITDWRTGADHADD